MARADFNLGNEVTLDLVQADGTLIDIGGLVEFEAEPISGVESSKPLTNQGRALRRTFYDGWKGTFKFDRQSNAMDRLQNLLESNYFAGGHEIYFQIQQTLRDPKTGQINQFQYEECCLYMKDGGKFAADKKVSQTMEFLASRRVELV